VTASHRHDRASRLRRWRGIAAVLIAVLYLLSGVLHGAHDIDVTSPAGGSEIAAMIDDGSAGHGDHKAIGGHHCHGCFSLAVAQPLQSTVATDIVAAHVARRTLALVGTAPDTDSPPPKHSA
jgi:hypothetical protein